MGYIEDLRSLVGTRPVILVGAVVVIVDDLDRILLQKRAQDGGWGLPGGLMELGESTEDTARREVQEEIGLRVGELTLLQLFSGEDYFVKMKHGDEFYSVTVVYMSRDVSGELELDPEESLEVGYFDPYDLPEGIVKRHGMMLKEILAKKYPFKKLEIIRQVKRPFPN